MSEPLSVRVLNSGYKPIPGGPGWDSAQQATWPTRTATLIAGERDAVLVDAFLTRSEGAELAEWVKRSGKSPSRLFITHGHADHFFGAGPTMAAFPEAQLVTRSPQTVAEARWQTEPQGLSVWNAWFEGQFDENPAVPTALTSDDFEIEGHAVHVSVAGAGDGVLTAILYVPEIATVCSGDVAYNNIHMWLWNSTAESRAAWLDSMDAVAALKPDTIITGHKDPDTPDDDARRILDQSRAYLEDFDRAVRARQLWRRSHRVMMAKYSTYGNPYTLFAAAMSQFGATS